MIVCLHIHDVAPLVGAWIETMVEDDACTVDWSHPSWVRGLKPMEYYFKLVQIKSHPSWVRGLKLAYPIGIKRGGGSHPSWVRGLKLQHINAKKLIQTSHPSWVRGLKPKGV